MSASRVSLPLASPWRFVIGHRKVAQWCVVSTAIGPPFATGCGRQVYIPVADLHLSAPGPEVCLGCLREWPLRVRDFPHQVFQSAVHHQQGVTTP